MDRVSKEVRSRIMSCVRSSGNKTTEVAFARLLRIHRLAGWTRRGIGLPGRPDFVFHKQRIAVFVDGCFWHGCPSCQRQPTTRPVYWRRRFATNMHRDLRVTRELKTIGWHVVRIWEHEVSGPKRKITRKLQRIEKLLES